MKRRVKSIGPLTRARVAGAIQVYGYHGFHAAVGDSFLRKGGLYGLSGVFTTNDRTTICTLKGGSCVDPATCTGRSQRQFVCTDTTLICCFTPPKVVVKKVFHLHEVDDDVTPKRKRVKSRRRKKFRGNRSPRSDFGSLLGLKHHQLSAYTDSSYQQQPNKH